MLNNYQLSTRIVLKCIVIVMKEIEEQSLNFTTTQPLSIMVTKPKFEEFGYLVHKNETA